MMPHAGRNRSFCLSTANPLRTTPAGWILGGMGMMAALSGLLGWCPIAQWPAESSQQSTSVGAAGDPKPSRIRKAASGPFPVCAAHWAKENGP